jgi:hypothetical protein
MNIIYPHLFGQGTVVSALNLMRKVILKTLGVSSCKRLGGDSVLIKIKKMLFVEGKFI